MQHTTQSSSTLWSVLKTIQPGQDLTRTWYDRQHAESPYDSPRGFLRPHEKGLVGVHEDVFGGTNLYAFAHHKLPKPTLRTTQ